jgi:hypothetical protein
MRLIFLIFLGMVYLVPLKAQKNYREAIDSGDFRRERGHYDTAINYYFAAEAFDPLRKGEVKKKIDTVFGIIDGVKRKAIDEKNRADSATKKAIDNENKVKKEKERVDSARKVFYLFNLANAPYKYVRLIRDMPIDRDTLLAGRFDSLLAAYNGHLDIIRDSFEVIPDDTFKKANIPFAKKDYEDLRYNLYFNNDLYEKLFYCLDAKGGRDLIFKKDAGPSGSLDSGVVFFTGGKDNFRLSDAGSIIWNDSNKMDTIERQGKKFTTFILNDSLKQLIAATDDHFIFNYAFDAEGNVRAIDSIALGAEVTAMDYADSLGILLFGTRGGDIGYILFNGDLKKYQPVYSTENFLTGSWITAVDYFIHDSAGYLLATGFDNKAVVYRIDNNFLLPGYKFSGNILPDPGRELGGILHGKYDAQAQMVRIEANNGTQNFLWDPFTDSALEKYRRLMRMDQTVWESIFLETKFY